MSAEQIAFQVTFASVESDDGSDPRERTEDILRSQRVLAAIRDDGGPDLSVLIPVTEAADVVALDADGALRFDLSTARLGELFAQAGMALQLGLADALDDVDAELEQEFGDAFEQMDDPAEAPHELNGFGLPEGAEDGEDLFDMHPVRVVEFSRRGPWAARLTAQLLGTEVGYLEDGTWSAYRYETDRVHAAISGGASDGPILEVNVPHDGHAWVEVSGPHGRSAMFWPNAERLTRPVLDVDAIAVDASAEVYRRMLSEIAGASEELAELGMADAVDSDAVLQACLPEALGGVTGERERVSALVAAFGVPESLVAAGLADVGHGRRYTPRGWLRMIGDLLLGGIGEATSLTRRDRPVPRLARLLRKRPVLGVALSTAELAAGVALSRGRSRMGRGLGILLLIDAIADLAIWAIRIRRR